jgi:hypothetical protein
MEGENVILLIIVFVLIIQPTIAVSQVELCGDPPPVANDELRGEIKGKAEFLSKFLGNAELSGNIQKSRTEIFSKYPEAERTRSNAYFEFQVCVLLMNDTKLTTTQKIEELKKIRREFSEPLGKKSSSSNTQDLERIKLAIDFVKQACLRGESIELVQNGEDIFTLSNDGIA